MCHAHGSRFWSGLVSGRGVVTEAIRRSLGPTPMPVLVILLRLPAPSTAHHEGGCRTPHIGRGLFDRQQATWRRDLEMRRRVKRGGC